MKKLFARESFWSFCYLVAALLGIWFLTRLWVPDGYVVTGHDSGLALDAGRFLKTRFFAWDVQDFGRDNSPHFGSLIIHGLDYLFSIAARVQFAGNQITIFFWISVVFVSGFVFASSLKDRLGKVFVFLFPVFVTFNFYILQSIFVFERAKYSILAASLLFLAIALKVQEKKISLFLGGILTSLCLFVFNAGSWLGLPLYGSFLVIALSFAAIELIKALKTKSFSSLSRFVLFLLVSIAGFLILNAYSILPYATTFLKQDVYAITNSGILAQNEAWLENMSQATSLLNIFRLQGIPDWYAGATKINTAHSYSELYLGNPFLIVVSFIFPFVVFTSFFLAKTDRERQLLSFFGFLTLVSMFFVAGTHPPLGFFYKFLYLNLPGFSIFRSPYFKFSGAFYIGISLLMAFTVGRGIEFVSSRLKRFKVTAEVLLLVFVLVLWFGYHQIIFFPEKIFTWQTDLSTRMRIPDYVYSFAQWLDSSGISESRILLVPELNRSWISDVYSWGYWSLTPLPSLVSNQSFVSNDVSGEQRVWVERLYSLIKQGEESEVLNLAQKLGIDYLLLRKDVLSDSSWSATASPTSYQKILDNFSNLEKVERFGEWTLYKFARPESPKVFAISSLISIPVEHSYLAQEHFSQNNVVIADNVSPFQQFLAGSIRVVSCVSCPLEGRDSLTSLPEIRILPNSPFYFFKSWRESKVLQNSRSDQEKSDAYLGFSLRRAAEVRLMWDIGVDQKSAVDSLGLIGSYLDQAYALFEPNAKTGRSFLAAKKIVDNFNVVERSFRDMVASGNFGKKSGEYREGILSVLWKINRLKELFPFIEDRDKLETEKVYSLPALTQRNKNLFLDESTLPEDAYGNKILPTNLKLEKSVSGLLRIEVPEVYDSGDLVLEFPGFPDLLAKGKQSLEVSPSGKKGCYRSGVQNFDSQKKYRIEIVSPSKNQVLKLFIKDSDTPSSKSNFLQGQDEVAIFPTVAGKAFNYIYRPSAGSGYSRVYLCSSNEEIPVFEKFEVHEISSPVILTIEDFSPQNLKLPLVYFEKVSPVNYRVKIAKAASPFILVFNESYNPNWMIKGENFFHFSLNGYANAWIIDRAGDHSLDLVYRPQELFYLGKMITVLGLAISFGAIGYLWLKRK